jgi:hypothetical protein
MVRRSNHRRRNARRSVVFRLAHGAMFVALLAMLLSACGTSSPEPAPETISLPEDVLYEKNVVGVQRLDTDSDKEKEWVVFYRFDQVENTGPVAALIYDVVVDPTLHLPVVYPHKLRTPHEDYLAQAPPKVQLVDLVAEASDQQPRKEVLFKTDTELAFFRLDRDPGGPPTDTPPLYRCIGFFRSRDGVSFNPENLEVVVTSRDGYERSQLVTRRYYKPDGDGYFITGTTMLVSPVGSQVDFPGDIPVDILDTPYSEKIVLAFYQTFGKADAKPTILEYLSAQAAQEFIEGKLKYGSPFPLNELKLAVVKELSYYPTEDASQSAVVIVKVVFHRANGEKSALIEVRWNLIRVANQWKMHYPES